MLAAHFFRSKTGLFGVQSSTFCRRRQCSLRVNYILLLSLPKLLLLLLRLLQLSRDAAVADKTPPLLRLLPLTQRRRMRYLVAQRGAVNDVIVAVQLQQLHVMTCERR